MEAWLLADNEAFAERFAVPPARVPVKPRGAPGSERALTDACRSSKRRDVRAGVAPPAGKRGTGPEYTAFLTGYCRETWRPEVAARSAPSLARALREIERLVTDRVWT